MIKYLFWLWLRMKVVSVRLNFWTNLHLVYILGGRTGITNGRDFWWVIKISQVSSPSSALFISLSLLGPPFLSRNFRAAPKLFARLIPTLNRRMLIINNFAFSVRARHGGHFLLILFWGAELLWQLRHSPIQISDSQSGETSIWCSNCILESMQVIFICLFKTKGDTTLQIVCYIVG